MSSGVPCRHCKHVYYGAQCANAHCPRPKIELFNKWLFAKSLRVHMAERGLSTRTAAAELGLCHSTLYRLSNYKKAYPPDIETFHKCVLWLQAKHEDFFNK